jgi:hypothetical protein
VLCRWRSNAKKQSGSGGRKDTWEKMIARIRMRLHLHVPAAGGAGATTEEVASNASHAGVVSKTSEERIENL